MTRESPRKASVSSNISARLAGFFASLSPRTLLYAGYVRLNNECNAKYSFNINGYTINTAHNVSSAATVPCNGKPSGAIFGIVHFF